MLEWVQQMGWLGDCMWRDVQRAGTGEKNRLRRILSMCMNTCRQWGRDVLNDRLRSNKHKLKHRQLCLNIKIYLLWGQLNIGSCYLQRKWSLPLETFKARLGTFISNLLQVIVVCVWTGGGLSNLQGSCPSQQLCDICDYRKWESVRENRKDYYQVYIDLKPVRSTAVQSHFGQSQEFHIH